MRRSWTQWTSKQWWTAEGVLFLCLIVIDTPPLRRSWQNSTCLHNYSFDYFVPQASSPRNCPRPCPWTLILPRTLVIYIPHALFWGPAEECGGKGSGNRYTNFVVVKGALVQRPTIPTSEPRITS